MPRLFRAMQEDAIGLPLMVPSARGLGVRPRIDVPAIRLHEIVHPGQGGLSVSPDDPMNLPYFRRPPKLQGTGKDPVWVIDATGLGTDLCYRPDPIRSGHGFIEPVRLMTLDEFQKAIAQTRASWRKI